MATSDRGFASMDATKQREIASKGGKASSGNFANDRKKASEAGKKGAAAQPIEAKRKGGEHSHSGSNG
ncbi:MAG TPA: KGG domain-containing protein [Candidatus Saccharimonadales bacterium]|nr:KGG domain-containing protein [Candidatus Saccharimonadales bacterium]